jgi:hypothetical protein
MAIILPSGFNILNNEPVDARITLADETTRYALSSANVYEGLIVFQQDSNTIWVLTDTSNVGNSNGWSQLQIGSISSNLPSGVVSSSQQIEDYNIFATTGSNIFVGNQVITGSLGFSGSVDTQTLAYAGGVGHMMMIDTNRTDTYTEIGSNDKPFKTLSAAITASNAANPTGTVPYTFVMMGCNINENIDFGGTTFNFITLATTCRTVFNGTLTIANNPNLKQLIIRNLEFAQPVTITGDGTSNQMNDMSFYNVSFSNTLNVSRANSLALWDVYSEAAVTLTNLNYLYVGGGQITGDITIVADSTLPLPSSGMAPGVAIIFDLICNNLTLTRGGTATYSLQPHNTRIGLNAGSYTIPTGFTVSAQASTFRGTWTNNGSFTLRNSSTDNAVSGTQPTYTGRIGGTFIGTVLSTNGVISGSSQLTSSLVDLTSAQTISGTKTFNDIVVNGTGSFAYIESVTGSAKIIGDAFIQLNNNTPAERYAGIVIIDSGSTPASASFYFDGQTNDWGYEYSSSAGIDYAVTLFGPEYATKGTPTYLTSNRIPKAVDNHHLNDSNISDSGTLITLNSNSQVNGNLVVNGTVSATNLISGSSQVSYPALSNIPAGIVSGSSQVNADSITNFDNNVKDKLNADTVVSGSSQITKTLQEVTTAGNTTSTSISITNSTAATDKTTGALVVTGGIGTSGDIFAGGDVVAYASSDIRLKDNVELISNPLQKINQIGGYSFVWNEEKQDIYKGTDYGVIAQEIEQILPELVDTRENGYKAVKYDKLVSLLIEGIKDLSKQVEELKEKINNQ